MQEEPFDSLSETSKYDLEPKAAEDFQQREAAVVTNVSDWSPAFRSFEGLE